VKSAMCDCLLGVCVCVCAQCFYHVVFLDKDVSRAWIPETHLRPYRGREKNTRLSSQVVHVCSLPHPRNIVFLLSLSSWVSALS